MLKKPFFVIALFTLCIGSAFTQLQALTPSSKEIQSANLLKPRMRDALILQLATEQYSSNLYLTIASYFDDLGLDGCTDFFRESSAEETEHALLFFDHLMDRGEKFQLSAVNAVNYMPTSVLDAFVKHYENEMKVTQAIHNLYTIAIEEKDYPSQVFLHDFLTLQVEEEKEAQDLVQLLKVGGNDPTFILLFDEKLREKIEG